MSLEKSDSINVASATNNGSSAGLLDSVQGTDAKLALKIMRGDQPADGRVAQATGSESEPTYGKLMGHVYVDTPAGKGVGQFSGEKTLQVHPLITPGKFDWPGEFHSGADSGKSGVGVIPDIDAATSARDDQALAKAVDALKARTGADSDNGGVGIRPDIDANTPARDDEALAKAIDALKKQ